MMMMIDQLPTAAGQTIYKICRADEWRVAQDAGAFAGSPDDVRDGFIHFSTAEQLPQTAAKHFRGEDGLLLLAVDADALGAPLRWEPSRGGALFPHLYGPLPVRAASKPVPLPLGDDGVPVLPDNLEAMAGT
ncbi:MAG: DUF952 domain-containing protein [Pseudomonadota bacterium]